VWRDAQFREFICVAGSVQAQIMLRAMRPDSLSRRIITYGSTRDGRPVSAEICNGIETRFDPMELQVAE
jgi:hypothetical protein